MAKEIVAWCDRCLADNDERVPASPVSVSLNNGAARVLDLCESCDKEIVEPLRALLTALGQPVNASMLTSKSSGMSKCPVPGCGKSYRQRSTLRQHVESMHETTLQALEEQLSNVSTGAASLFDDESEPKPFACDHPGCDRTFAKAQGVGLHKVRAHGYEPVTGDRASA